MNANPAPQEISTVRWRSSSSGTIGCRPRAWARTNTAAAPTVSRAAAQTWGAANPAEPASIAANVSAPIARTALICPVTSKGTARPGERAAKASSSHAATPTGRLMKKIVRQLIRLAAPPATGPAAEATAPPFDRIGVRLADQRQAVGHHPGRPGTLHQAGGDQGGQAGGQPARGGSGHEHHQAQGERPARADLIGERTSRQQQGCEHQGVAVDDPLRDRHPTAQVGPDGGQGDI
jgi:hypothetical protein